MAVLGPRLRRDKDVNCARVSALDVRGPDKAPLSVLEALFALDDSSPAFDVERAIARPPEDDVVGLRGPDAGRLFCVASHEDTGYTWSSGLPLLYLLHKSVYTPNGVTLSATGDSSHHQRVKVRTNVEVNGCCSESVYRVSNLA